MKIEVKGFIKTLGQKSATIYIPIYNIIKEVEWPTTSEYTSKDGVMV